MISNLLLKIVDNPVNALQQANYIGILSWATVFGIAMREVSEHSKDLLQTLADITSKIVEWIVQPSSIWDLRLGLHDHRWAKDSVPLATTGFSYLFWLVPWLCSPGHQSIDRLFMIRKNPYPLVLNASRVSGVTAFFTRSSAANIPVNMRLCEELGLNPDTYSGLHSTWFNANMAGAAVTINILTLAAANTLHIQVDFGTALILSVVAAISACGASGVAGGISPSHPLLLVASLVSPMIWPCKSSASALSSGSSKTLAKHPQLFIECALHRHRQEMSSWPKEKRY